MRTKTDLSWGILHDSKIFLKGLDRILSRVANNKDSSMACVLREMVWVSSSIILDPEICKLRLIYGNPSLLEQVRDLAYGSQLLAS